MSLWDKIKYRKAITANRFVKFHSLVKQKQQQNKTGVNLRTIFN